MKFVATTLKWHYIWNDSLCGNRKEAANRKLISRPWRKLSKNVTNQKFDSNSETKSFTWKFEFSGKHWKNFFFSVGNYLTQFANIFGKVFSSIAAFFQTNLDFLLSLPERRFICWRRKISEWMGKLITHGRWLWRFAEELSRFIHRESLLTK